MLAYGLQAESCKSFIEWLLAYRALARVRLPAWGRVQQGRWHEGSPRAIEHTQGICNLALCKGARHLLVVSMKAQKSDLNGPLHACPIFEGEPPGYNSLCGAASGKQVTALITHAHFHSHISGNFCFSEDGP